MRYERKQIAFFLLPAIIVALFLGVYPTIEAVDLSVHNRNFLIPGRNDFVFVDNFVGLLYDPQFWNALEISFAYSGANVIFSVSIGLGLALFVRQYVKGRLSGLLTFCFVLPFVLSRVATSFMWRFMYNPMIGVYTYLLGLFGIGPIDLLGSPNLAFFAVLTVDVWQWCYFIGVLLLSSMQLLPPEPAEAARIDGASKLQLFRHITLPLLGPTLTFIIFLRWIESLRSFDLIYNMTKGGPGTSTEILDLYAYRIGIGSGGNISYAAAMSLVMLALTIIITSVARSRWFPE